MPLPRLCNHEIAESDFPPILVADDGNDEDEDEEEDEEERRRDEEEEEEEPIWTAPPSGRGSCASRPPVPSGVATRKAFSLSPPLTPSSRGGPAATVFSADSGFGVGGFALGFAPLLF